jgi:hypothetical protein
MRQLRRIGLRPLVLAIVVGAAGQAWAQDARVSYPRMSPLKQYLMSDRNAEIALARSAAPAAISADATVLVLGQRGYETAVKGKNKFVCLVDRSWMNPFAHPEFWNPKVRAPLCFNPQGARSVLPVHLKRTELVLAGLSKSEMQARLRAAFDKKELQLPEAGALSYMMSKEQYIGDKDQHYQPHLMFYVPLTDGKDWGADLPHSPVMLLPQFQGKPEPLTTFVVPVTHWSEGTPATAHRHP